MSLKLSYDECQALQYAIWTEIDKIKDKIKLYKTLEEVTIYIPKYEERIKMLEDIEKKLPWGRSL